MADTPSQGYWTQHVQAQCESGLNIKAYARRENLSVTMLYHWRSQLGYTKRRAQALNTTGAGFAQARVAILPAEPRALGASQAAPSTCRLTLGPGMHLEMVELPSPQWLLALVNACRGAR